MEFQMSSMTKPLTPPYSDHHNLLPSPSTESLRILPDHIAIPETTIIPRSRLSKYLSRALDQSRMNVVDSYLRFASRPAPTRPLHMRVAMGHTIVLDERPDWHLVTWRTGLSVKPLPRFLLSHIFFRTHLCSNATLHADACGMLLSYADLVRTESDYRIAQSLGLLPDRLAWMAWAAFMAEVVARVNGGGVAVNPRYRFGELRRTELVLINWAVHGWRRRYYYIFTDFVTFGLANYGRLIAVFAVVSILLSGLELGMSTNGTNHTWFVDMGWGFALAVIGTVFGSIAVLSLLFASYYLGNKIVALRYDRTMRRGGQKSGEETDEISWGYEPTTFTQAPSVIGA